MLDLVTPSCQTGRKQESDWSGADNDDVVLFYLWSHGCVVLYRDSEQGLFKADCPRVRIEVQTRPTNKSYMILRYFKMSLRLNFRYKRMDRARW